MNKKGFMFVETIVTLTILMTLLLTLYAIFVNLLQKEKVNVEYDKYGDRMALFYIKEMMLKKPTYFNEDDNYIGNNVIDDESLKKYNVQALVIGTCDGNRDISVGELPEQINNDFSSFIKGIIKCEKNENKVVLFGEFQHGATYSYAHIFYPNY